MGNLLNRYRLRQSVRDCLRGTSGRARPNLSILAISVFREIPSSLAARLWLPPHRASASLICLRSVTSSQSIGEPGLAALSPWGGDTTTHALSSAPAATTAADRCSTPIAPPRASTSADTRQV